MMRVGQHFATRRGKQPRMTEDSRGVHAAAAQASRLQTRRLIVVASVHPYAFLGTTPGFMKPDRARTRRAG